MATPAQPSFSVERATEPLPVPDSVVAADPILFFGGSFDPPHRAHATLSFAAAAARWPGRAPWVVFVPAARSPHKPDAPAEDRHRVEMLRLALGEQSRCWIWEQELADAPLNPGQPSFWADTWSIARRTFPPRDLAFLIGTDQALSMHRWRRYQEFWQDALVMLRAEELTESDFAARLRTTGAWTSDEIDHWVSRLVRTPVVDASSTEIRAALADPTKRNARIEGLDPGVQKYILEKGLYAPA
jgi:nicotinate-nucleotide adenylyltransferase